LRSGPRRRLAARVVPTATGSLTTVTLTTVTLTTATLTTATLATGRAATGRAATGRATQPLRRPSLLTAGTGPGRT
jgi:hypothetical protein